MKLTIKRKLGIGFGSVVLLIITMSVVTYWFNQQVSRAEVEATRYAGWSHLMTEKLVDHYKWLDKLNGTFLRNEASVQVQTDHHKCGLGSWLYGPEAAALAEADPQAAELLEALEEPHHHLHQSAIQVDNIWQQSIPGLEQELWNALDAHGQWAKSVANAILAGKKQLDVELDPTQCGYGRFLHDEHFQTALAKVPSIREAIDSTVVPHQQLHGSGERINAALMAGDVEEAAQIYREVTLPLLDEVSKGLREAVAEVENIRASQDKALEVLNIDTKEKLGRDQHPDESSLEAGVEIIDRAAIGRPLLRVVRIEQELGSPLVVRRHQQRVAAGARVVLVPI
ncbi:MAG: CZB domain-containing protein, partial [Rhodospirillales bacterium]|nr:CZB domain-containing protein [Rhodospirillales bacterium]